MFLHKRSLNLPKDPKTTRFPLFTMSSTLIPNNHSALQPNEIYWMSSNVQRSFLFLRILFSLLFHPLKISQSTTTPTSVFFILSHPTSPCMTSGLRCPCIPLPNLAHIGVNCSLKYTFIFSTKLSTLKGKKCASLASVVPELSAVFGFSSEQ